MERWKRYGQLLAWSFSLVVAAGSVPAEARAASPSGSGAEATLSASVRIRVEDGNTFAWGSGTIIDGLDGEAYVLTCGHLFRDVSAKSVTKVDLFGDSGYDRVVADVVDFDLDKDIALLRIDTERKLPRVKLAGSSYPLKAGASVISIGCPHGSEPNVQQTQIVSVNKYLGPSNLQTRGAPKQGRSGGGLFTVDGQLIGVCVAADNQDNEGLFMSLPVIHEFLLRQTL